LRGHGWLAGIFCPQVVENHGPALQVHCTGTGKQCSAMPRLGTRPPATGQAHERSHTAAHSCCWTGCE
jgi:hypothetical protein